MLGCADPLTEDQIDSVEGKMEASIVLIDGLDVGGKAPLANVDVALLTVSQGAIERTTDNNGFASFGLVDIGTYVVVVKGPDVVPFQADIDVTRDNAPAGGGVQAQILALRTNGPTASVQGQVSFESDLTNSTPETMGGIVVAARQYVLGRTYIFRGTTDASGFYSIKLPLNLAGSQYATLSVEAFEVDQKLAVNKLASEKGSYFDNATQVFPRIITTKALFGTAAYDQYNFSVPTDVPPVYGVADPAVDPANTAILWPLVDSEGRIFDVSIFDGGDYTGDPDNKVKVDIRSLAGGSGATLEFDVSIHKDLITAYVNNAFTMVPGSGYPTALSFNQVPASSPSYNSTLVFSPAAMLVTRNIYLGTGWSRPVAVE